ncbi:hypothetical protein ICW40_20605, partial [Actinotalea ferrariae]|nr:hypothetical protein [Actinotalea ferrariae]
MLAHSLQREVWRVVLLVCGLLWALLSLPSVVGGMLWLSGQPVDVAHDILVVGGSLLVLGWLVVPLLVPGLDDSLDISRFATFAVPVRRLVPGLLAASLLGLPTLFSALVCLAPALAWAGSGRTGAVVALLVAPVALATCVVGARVTTGLASRVLASRRSREAGAVLGLVVVGLAVPAALSIGSMGLEGALERVPALAQVLGWSPLGLVWATPAAAADGDLAGAAARGALALVWLAAAVVAWAVLLR